MTSHADRLKEQAKRFKKLSDLLFSPIENTTTAQTLGELARGLCEICLVLAEVVKKEEEK